MFIAKFIPGSVYGIWGGDDNNVQTVASRVEFTMPADHFTCKGDHPNAIPVMVDREDGSGLVIYKYIRPAEVSYDDVVRLYRELVPKDAICQDTHRMLVEYQKWCSEINSDPDYGSFATWYYKSREYFYE